MTMMQPLPTPYDPLQWSQRPLEQRGRMVCEAWALQGYGPPLIIYFAYAFKLALYVAGWLWFCSFTPGMHGVKNLEAYWLEPIAFQKAILWSALFEGLGLGCGSGPLTGRYVPPIGGLLYFARPGTTRLPALPNTPGLRGHQRGVLDVALYVVLVAALLRALCAPAIGPSLVWPIVILLPLLGLRDRTVFLAFRSEHYWTTSVCFLFASNFIAGAKAVQLALWWWAGVSKLNHHFPAVVCVMNSNSPFTRRPWLRKPMYRAFPRDLRPSRLAQWMAHVGTALELSVPLWLLWAGPGWTLVVGMCLMLLLHGFITSNVPMGVPLEWNLMVVYGGFALFWAHPDVSPFAIHSLPLAGVLIAMLVVVPLVGNLAPSRISFLLAMRYYAGNWACSVWLFRGDSQRKLERLTTSAPPVDRQLEPLYGRATSIGLLGRVMGFRLMHLHGRALPGLIARAVERFEDYEYVDGEIVAGRVLGWNFGDGHLHDEQLLSAVQAQCGFEPGELRCVFIESQPLGRARLRYRICDAALGQLEQGHVSVAALRAQQPYEAVAPSGHEHPPVKVSA